MCFHQLHEPEQNMAAFGRPHRAPGPFKSSACGGDGALDIDLVAFRDRRDGLFSGRVQGCEGAPGDGRHPLAIDQQQLGL